MSIHKNKRSGFFLYIVLSLAAIFVGAFFLRTGPVEAAKPKIVKIGVLAPLTGGASADGEEFVRGAKLAVKEINAAGGVKGYTFKVVTGDTKDMGADAVISAFQKLIADEAVGCMVTGYASMTNFEIQNMAEINMPYIISANAAQTLDIISKAPDKYPTVWSIVPNYDVLETELPRVLELWASEGTLALKSREVAVIASDNPFSKTIAVGLKKNFLKYHWTVTMDEMVPFKDIHDWRIILSKIRKNPPDLVVNTDYWPANEATFLDQFLEDPVNSLIFMQYAPSVPEFLELTKDKSTGIIYNLMGDIIPSSKSELAADFHKKFKAEYGIASGSYGCALRDSVYIYANALKKVGDPKDRLAIGRAIGETDMMTARGRVKFDHATHLAFGEDEFVPIMFYQIWEGERILLYPPRYSTGKFRMPPWMQP